MIYPEYTMPDDAGLPRNSNAQDASAARPKPGRGKRYVCPTFHVLADGMTDGKSFVNTETASFGPS